MVVGRIVQPSRSRGRANDNRARFPLEPVTWYKVEIHTNDCFGTLTLWFHGGRRFFEADLLLRDKEGASAIAATYTLASSVVWNAKDRAASQFRAKYGNGCHSVHGSLQGCIVTPCIVDAVPGDRRPEYPRSNTMISTKKGVG